MMLKGKGIGHGIAEGEILLSQTPISFLGGVDPYKGIVIDSSSDIFNRSIAGKILAFPHGKGSTVGSYVIYQLLKSGKAPAGIVNENAETIVATGAILAGIPMLSGIPLSALSSGDQALLNAENGTLELKGVLEEPIVMAILMNKDKILLLRHEKKSKLLGGQWLGISEKIAVGSNPEDITIDAVKEQTGMEMDRSDIRIRGEIVYVRTGQVLLKISPFLIATEQTEIELADGYDEFKWLPLSGIKSIKTMVGLDRIVGSLLARNDPERKIC